MKMKEVDHDAEDLTEFDNFEIIMEGYNDEHKRGAVGYYVF